MVLEKEKLVTTTQTLNALGREYQEWLNGLDLTELKLQYPSTGNIINYVCTLLEGVKLGQLDSAIEEASENLLTAIIESPIAESVGTYTYFNNWEVRPDGTPRMKSKFGYMDDIIERSIDDKTGQVPSFERQRNRYDQIFLDHLTNTRKTGQTNPLIKFSPSPENLDDPEVRARGYKGYDQISIFEEAPNNQEKITIHWFPKISGNEYCDLLTNIINVDKTSSINGCIQEIINNIESSSDSLDTKVMQVPENLSYAQIEFLRNYLKNKKNTSKNKEEITDYCYNFIQNAVESNVLESVQTCAIKLIQGLNPNIIRQDLEYIFNLIRDLQFNLKLFLNQQTEEPLAGTHGDIPKLDKYAEESLEARLAIIDSLGITTDGCGFSDAQDINLLVDMLLIYGPSDSFIFPIALIQERWFENDKKFDLFESVTGESASNQQEDELYKFICPNCAREHNIDVPNGIYIQQCSCGFDAKC